MDDTEQKSPFNLDELAQLLHKGNTNQKKLIDSFQSDVENVRLKMDNARNREQDEFEKQKIISKICEFFRYKTLKETQLAYEFLLNHV